VAVSSPGAEQLKKDKIVPNRLILQNVNKNPGLKPPKSPLPLDTHLIPTVYCGERIKKRQHYHFL